MQPSEGKDWTDARSVSLADGFQIALAQGLSLTDRCDGLSRLDIPAGNFILNIVSSIHCTPQYMLFLHWHSTKVRNTYGHASFSFERFQSN